MREIPQEHQHLPEAERLKAAQAEFLSASQALLNANRAARAAGEYVTDDLQEKADALSRAEVQLKDAEAEYDRAVGEPKPVKLSDVVRKKLEETFASELHGEAKRNRIDFRPALCNHG
jgi:hypothetical protein